MGTMCLSCRMILQSWWKGWSWKTLPARYFMDRNAAIQELRMNKPERSSSKETRLCTQRKVQLLSQHCIKLQREMRDRIRLHWRKKWQPQVRTETGWNCSYWTYCSQEQEPTVLLDCRWIDIAGRYLPIPANVFSWLRTFHKAQEWPVEVHSRTDFACSF